MTCFFETCIPSMTWRCVIMRRVKFLMLKTSFAKVFKYIHKHENIRFEIKVAIITNSFTVEGIPNIKRVLVIRIADFFIIQLNKLWFGRELCFREASDWRNIVVRINSLLCEKPDIIFNDGLCVFEIRRLKIWNKIGKRCLKKLERVNKPDFTINWNYFTIFSSVICIRWLLSSWKTKYISPLLKECSSIHLWVWQVV